MDDVSRWQLNGSGLVFWVRTAAGMEYEIDDAPSGARLRRRPARFDPIADVPCTSSRHNAEWIMILGCSPIIIGRPISFLLESLSDPGRPDCTPRTTAPVVSVETRPPDSSESDAEDAP